MNKEKIDEFRFDFTEKQMEIFQSHGTTISLRGVQTYMFLPFWIEKCDDGFYKMHKLGDLPEDLVHLIKSFRIDEL